VFCLEGDERDILAFEGYFVRGVGARSRGDGWADGLVVGGLVDGRWGRRYGKHCGGGDLEDYFDHSWKETERERERQVKGPVD